MRKLSVMENVEGAVIVFLILKEHTGVFVYYTVIVLLRKSLNLKSN